MSKPAGGITSGSETAYYKLGYTDYNEIVSYKLESKSLLN